MIALAPVAGEPAAADGALPSIIIDPSISDTTPSRPPGASGASRAAAAQERLQAAIDLDAAEADRFAANFRPSWQPPVAATTATVPSARPSPRPQKLPSPLPASMPARAAESHEEPLTLPLARSRKRAQLWVGGSVLGFLVLVYFAVASSSKVPVPPTAAPTAPTASTAQQPAPAATPQAPPPTQNPAAPAPQATTAPSAPPQPVAVAEVKAPEPTPSSPAPAAALARNAPAPPKTVRLRVATEPRQATLLLNGAAVTNPFDARLPLAGTYQLEARAPGHEPAQRTISLAREERISLVLTRVLARAVTHAPPTPTRPTIARAEARIRPVAHRAPPPTARASRPKPAKSQGAGFVADSPY